MTSDRNSLLRERFENGTGTNAVFTVIITFATCAFLWAHSPPGRLMIWAGLMGLSTAIVVGLRLLQLSFDRWYRAEAAAQMVAGVGWGLLPVLAMPEDPVYQALVIAVVASVVISSSAGESQFSMLHVCFAVPMSALVLLGYFAYSGGPATPAWFYLIAMAYSVVAGSADRDLHHRLVDATIENETLVQELEQEHAALAAVNAQLDQLVWTDTLTGLANRAAALRRLDEVLLEATPGTPAVTVAYLDIDEFKEINDVWGHGVGDGVLVKVAERMQTRLRPSELACRLGGDELIVISTHGDAEDLGDRLASVFDHPFRVVSNRLSVSSSIGLATARRHCSADEVLRRADTALYRHKRDPSPGRWEMWQASDGLSTPDAALSVDRSEL